jgi:perosamine synthetase
MSELQAAVACAQLEKLDELVAMRCAAAALFDAALTGYEALLKRQIAPLGCVSSEWCWSAVLVTDNPETEWFEFRQLWLDNVSQITTNRALFSSLLPLGTLCHVQSNG